MLIGLFVIPSGLHATHDKLASCLSNSTVQWASSLGSPTKDLEHWQCNRHGKHQGISWIPGESNDSFGSDDSYLQHCNASSVQ